MSRGWTGILIWKSREGAKMREVPDGYELDDGRLVPLCTSARSSWVSGKILSVLMRHCDETELGWCFPPGTVYRCFSPRQTARRPDVSFLRRGRLLNEELPWEDLTISPDLAVEVVAPGDLVEELDLKVEDYLRAGVRLVWIVNPDTKSVLIHRANGTMARLRDRQDLDGEDVLPGFRFPLRELWPRRLEKTVEPLLRT